MTSRRGIVIGAALAAAAILVPLAGIALTRDEGPARDDGTGSTPSPSVTRSATGTPTATPTPSPTPTPEPSPTDADPQPWRVSGLTTGRPPAVPYVVNGRIHLPDGTTLATGGAPSPLLRLADERWLSTTFDQETSESEVELRDARFGLLSRFPLQSYAYPVLSPTGQTAVWARPDGSVLALQAGAAKPTVVGSVPEGGTIGAVTGDDCRSSCAIYGTSGSSAGAPLPGAWSMDASGTVRAVDDSLLTVFDAVPEARLVGYTEITDDGSCSALVDAATGSTRWTTCANSLDSFSPDGALVLASEAYHDGWGSGEIGIYDAATGLRLLDLVRTGERFSGYQQALWEDDGHLLVTTYADGAWEIVRIGVDGSMEYALPPVPGDELGGVVQLVVG